MQMQIQNILCTNYFSTLQNITSPLFLSPEGPAADPDPEAEAATTPQGDQQLFLIFKYK